MNRKSCLITAAFLVTTASHAAVGLEDVCIYYNATSSATVGFKVAAKVSIWQKNILCGVIYVDPGSTECYRYTQSATCNTAATAATQVLVEPLYVNGTLAIPASTAYQLTGSSGTTSVEHLTVGNGAWTATNAAPSVITAGTLYTITADYLEPGLQSGSELSQE